eukprot:CAMPEP_0172588668 /NCGR_PEP_ID=MMETSP1068-20121228/7549_1 /TAXON_ID=35684 /ORGANISM="Pseudopedinella elastica, Strain CCMP716" /LENGTH=172 /DNA_ID=CAMNT_0013384073 /DNA_START=87 /DNA_END=605 /DNA_ORIENTATION=-
MSPQEPVEPVPAPKDNEAGPTVEVVKNKKDYSSRYGVVLEATTGPHEPAEPAEPAAPEEAEGPLPDGKSRGKTTAEPPEPQVQLVESALGVSSCTRVSLDVQAAPEAPIAEPEPEMPMQEKPAEGARMIDFQNAIVVNQNATDFTTRYLGSIMAPKITIDETSWDFLSRYGI